VAGPDRIQASSPPGNASTDRTAAARIAATISPEDRAGSTITNWQ